VRLQRLVDRAVYGTRRDPVAAVSAVGRRLAGDDFGGVADALRETLRLSYVAIEKPDGSIADSGEPTDSSQTWPLTYDGKLIGKLVVGPRRGEHQLSRSDQKVMDLVAAPLAIVLHSQMLTEDLKASRERVIDAAEEERTRLRRELHDSLGPLLTGAARWPRTESRLKRSPTWYRTSTDEDPFPQLTPREHDVLRLLAEGSSNSAIASRLGLSLKTVNNNTSSIFSKLNVGTRTEAAILARDRGLGSTSK
jgi:DNA-binding NarL/FixJ family response regulator